MKIKGWNRLYMRQLSGGLREMKDSAPWTKVFHEWRGVSRGVGDGHQVGVEI